MKDGLRAWVRPIGQWAVVAANAPQDLVAAEFTSAGAVRDVTHDHSVAALSPLTIAVAGAASVAEGRLTYRDAVSGAELGWLWLRNSGAVGDIGLFDVVAGDHRCVAWPLRPWNRRLQMRAQDRQVQKPGGLIMPAIDVQRLMISYIAPRPVVLVSVVGPHHGNMFPMDLIGPIGGDRFTLALRRSSASADVMRDEGRVALSDPPAQARADVYGLGGHHRQAMIDWTTLPFPVTASDRFGIPVPAEAIRVRELAIDHAQDIGSHRLFVGRIVSERPGNPAPQLHHTAGFHQYYRRRRGEPLQSA